MSQNRLPGVHTKTENMAQEDGGQRNTKILSQWIYHTEQVQLRVKKSVKPVCNAYSSTEYETKAPKQNVGKD